MSTEIWTALVVGIALAAGGPSSVEAAGQKGKETKAPEGWKEYQPEEKDFTLLVPGEPDAVTPDPTAKDQTVRNYSWVKGDARMTLIYSTDRKGEALKDDASTLKLLRVDPDIVKGTLKDVKLDAMPGIEYSRKELDGTTAMYRVYRAADGSRGVNLMILKADKLTAAERAAFLSSFQFAKPKK